MSVELIKPVFGWIAGGAFFLVAAAVAYRLMTSAIDRIQIARRIRQAPGGRAGFKVGTPVGGRGPSA